MDIKLYSLDMNYNGKDRLYFSTQAERASAFSVPGATVRVSSFERVDDLRFNVDVYGAIDNIRDYNYAIYNGYHCFIDSMLEKDKNKASRIILRLDVITQYITGDQLDDNKEVLVKRTHLDRFTEVGVDEYRFNFNDDDLLIQEDMNIQPNIYGSNNFTYTEESGTTIKWLTITRTVADADPGDPLRHDHVFNQFRYNGVIRDSIVRMPNVTYFMPLMYDKVVYKRENGTEIGTGRLENIMEIATTTDILDVEILSYNPNKMIKSLVIDDISEVNPFVIVTIDDDYLFIEPGNINIAKLDKADSDTYMMTNNIFGERITLEPCTAEPGADTFAHRPLFTAQEIATDPSLEPKLLQFYKYDISYMQNKFDAFFDQLKNDEIIPILQAGLNYGTNRYDFYLESGNYNNFKNTGGIMSVINDNTMAMNVDQWKEYIAQKKTTGSAGYAYGGQVATGALGGLSQLATGNAVGAVGSVAGTIANIGNTYAQRQDLKQAPNQVKARGANVLNDMPYCETFLLSFSEVQPTESEKRFILNRLIYNGYLLNDYKNIKDVIDTRENFNYIELINDDHFLNTAVSTEIATEINRLMNQGVRLYKSISKLTAKSKLNLERSL